MNRSFKDFPGSDAAVANDETLDIGEILRMLWRGKWQIAIVLAITLTLGIYQAYVRATPLYQSTAVVMLESREENVVDLESVIGGLSADASVINTEVQVLKSRSLLARVVEEMALTEDSEFNRFLRSPSLMQRVRVAVRDGVGFSSRVAAPATEEEIATRNREASVDGLLARLTVSNVAQSLVFRVTIETTDPRKSARIANKLVELYILNQLEVKFLATEQATNWLTGRVSELEFELERAEGLVKSFRAETDLISSDALEALERQLKDTRDREAGLLASLSENEARVIAFNAAQTPEEKLAAAGRDVQLQRFLSNISDPTNARAFDTRYEQIASRARLELERDTTQLAAVQSSKDALEGQIQGQSADLITLQQLTREAEASRLLYEYFLSRLKETSAQEGIQQADSRILSEAVIPVSPSSPRKRLILLMSGIFGLMVGSLLVVLREMRNDTFRDPRLLERVTGYHVMGQVPIIPGRRRKETIEYLLNKPTSSAAEAIRNLRTSVLLSNVDHPPKVILVSSSRPGEGKTTLSVALTQNLAAMNKSVLLIEGDVRRLVVRQYIGETVEHGLLSVVTGKKTLAEALVRSQLIGADVLLGEKGNVNAADIFSSERFIELMEQARQQYDHVIIDTPPVLLVPDGRIIAQHVDATLLTVCWDQTSKSEVAEALRQFESVNKPVSGLVLNQINAREMMRYGYGGQYGAYATYGSKYYVN